MYAQSSRVETFADFFAASEPRLRESLMATLGGDAGADAAAEALEYGWANWDRVAAMDNPVGYLYRVGRSRGRRKARRRRPRFDTFETSRLPDVEPKLPVALSRLSERQRVAVVLVHCYEWTQSEVAEWLGLSRSSVQNHLERGMASLRRSIGGTR
jgi:RNA polymerase sigma-70 factor (ECF subfamily)